MGNATSRQTVRNGWMLGLLVAALLATTLLPASLTYAAGREWYVATNGSNSNNGTSGAPLATLQEAVNRAAPGDTIIVRAGTYTVTQPITINNKQGSSSAVLTIRGEGLPVFRAASFESIPVWEGIISIQGSSYLTIQGLRLENSGWFGFKATNSSNLTFDGNQSAVSLASAIYTYNVTNLAVRNNDVSRFCDQKESVRGSTCQEGISIVLTNGFDVSRNIVHDAPEGDGMNPGGGEGIDIKEGSKNGTVSFNQVYNLVQIGIYIDAWDKLTENIEVYGNRVYRTASGIAINAEAGGTLSNLKVHDNIIYDVGYHGIEIANTGSNGLRQGVHLYNNTIVRSGYQANKPPWCARYGCSDWGYGIRINTSNISDIAIHDNIVVDNHSAAVSLDTGGSYVNLNTNILYPRRGYSWAFESFGANPIEADPRFVNAAANDFHLRADSPAIGRGIGGDPLNVDADGRTRPSWPIDLGALIYTSGGSGNLLQNPSFASGCAYWNGCSVTTTSGAYNNNSAQIGSYGWIGQRVAAQAGRLYTFTAYIKTTCGPGAFSGFGYSAYTSSGASLVDTYPVTSADSTWQQKSFSVTAPANAAFIQVNFYNGGNGCTMYVDEVSLTT